MNYWDEIRNALSKARDAEIALNCHAQNMAPLLRERLRKISTADAAALKRELRDFDLRTGRWKNP